MTIHDNIVLSQLQMLVLVGSFNQFSLYARVCVGVATVGHHMELGLWPSLHVWRKVKGSR